MKPERPSPDALLASLERPSESSSNAKVRVFVIFDTVYDEDLYALLDAQSKSAECGFSVVGGSIGPGRPEAELARMYRRMREADQVIVICGEHTESSPTVHTELLDAIEEGKPYFLLWGRRGAMCKKPMGTSSTEGMYGWTGQILHDQIALRLRESSMHSQAKKLRRVVRDGRLVSDPAIE